MQNAPKEHSAIFSSFIKLSFVFKTFVLSICECSSLRQVLLYNLIFISVVALDDTNISSCLHFSMQRIEMSCETAPLGGVTSTSADNFLYLSMFG